MKRSEMITQLIQLLALCESLDKTNYKDQAEEILSLIELRGMLPPAFTCINTKNKKKTNLGSCTLYEWESEND